MPEEERKHDLGNEAWILTFLPSNPIVSPPWAEKREEGEARMNMEQEVEGPRPRGEKEFL